MQANYQASELVPLIKEWTIEHRLPLITEEIKRRYFYRELIQRNTVSIGQELEKCKRDPVHWFGTWVWTYDPRGMPFGLPANMPFVLRPKQIELVNWLSERLDTQTSGLIEKSRDEGMSYVVLGFMLHQWLFVRGFAGGVGSRKEELVDKKGDPKTLFHKFRDMLYKLPDWMMPEGFNGANDNYMRVLNPAMESSITGEAGDNIGRGGRTSLYFLDEWAFVANQASAYRAVSQNTNVRIKGSTPNGVGDRFYSDRHSGKYPVFTMPWQDNPDKNWTIEYKDEVIYPWYEKQKAELDPVDIAQEVDLDYHASIEGIVIPAAYVQAAFKLQIDRGYEKAAGVDVGSEGSDKSAYSARNGAVVLPSIAQHGGLHIASELKQKAIGDNIDIMNYDKLGVGASLTATIARQEGLSFIVRGIANSERPSNIIYPDNEHARAFERFYNLAAELWWRLRLRFENTYKRVELGEDIPDEECISLFELREHPLRDTIKAQLSQATYEKYGASDKIKVNKYGNGTASPDVAEAIMYAFAPPPPTPDTPFLPTSHSIGF